MQYMVSLGKISVSYYHDPTLNSVIYKVGLSNGHAKEYVVDLIEKNVLVQVVSEVFSMTLVESMADYNKYGSVLNKKDRYVITQIDHNLFRNTSKGLKLLILWKDGSKSCILLNDKN